MMEYSSDMLLWLLYQIDEKPMLLTTFAAFHILVVLIVFGIGSWLLKIVGIRTEKMGPVGFGISIVIAVGWILGFISQILLLFMGVTGVQMFFIYIAMYLFIIMFVIANIRPLMKNFIDS